MVLGVGNNAVVLLTAGIALKLVQGDYLRQFLGFVVYTSDIAPGGYAGHIETAAEFLSGHYLFKGVDDLGNQPTGDTVIARQEGVALKEAFATATAVTAFPKVQKGVSCQRNILDRLHPIVVHTVCDRATDRTGMLFLGKLDINVEFFINILHICYHYIFQIEKFCGIILIEHRDISFVVIGGTFIIKDFTSMLNLWL